MYARIRTNVKGVAAKLRYFFVICVLLGMLITTLFTPVVSAQAAAVKPASIGSITAGPGRRFLNSNASILRSSLAKRFTNNASGSNSPTIYYNWSGYAATSTSAFNEVQSTFVQPAVTCPVPGAWTLFWVGFDGFTNNTVEQAGTAAQCSSGSNPKPAYYAWWEMWPTNNIQVMPITVSPGNSIQATVSYTASNGRYSLNVTDLSNRQQYTQVTSCAANLQCSRQSAEWIVERPTLNGAYTPLANWGTMSLASNQASNSTTTNRRKVVSYVLKPVSSFSNTPIDMVNDPYTGEMLATVTPLDKTGTTFSDTWSAAQ